jgi:non-specific serine/threonine protein kinase
LVYAAQVDTVNEGRSTANFHFDRFILQRGERRLLADGQPVPLESRAFDLLSVLIDRAGQLVTKDELLERVWPNRVVEDANLHVHVSALRKALGPDSIATVAGHGYRFALHAERVDGEIPRPAVLGSNLPRPLTSFVGREDDLALLAGRLQSTRLLTLIGMGGCGKTRLAIKLAERVSASFPDGLRFVDLASVTDPRHVALAVATSIGVREEADKPIEATLCSRLADKQILLVLDNCEHLVEACAAIAGSILGTAAGPRVLVTSREALAIAGESVVRVRSLALPSADPDQDTRSLIAIEAVCLFVERARQVAPEFDLNEGNAAAVAEICRRLDGIPLALELAAARVKLLSVEQILGKLDDRFRLLTGGPRSISRHQTLLATLQSSYEYLTPDEQQCLLRLSLFASGWTLEAATAIGGYDEEIQVVELLGRLIDKSLVLVDRTVAHGPRYSMLETVRHYAQDRLHAAGAGDDVRERHVAHFLEFARKAQANLFGESMRQWLERIDIELPNLLAAHAWCDRARDGTNQGLDLAVNLRTYWLARGLFVYGQRVYAEALARKSSDSRAMLRGRALYALGQHNYVLGRLHESLDPTLEALSIAREHADDELTVYCLDRISLAYGWLGQTKLALECCAEELAIATRTGDERLIGFALTARGGVCRVIGDFPAAVEAYEQALLLFEKAHDLHNLHNVLVNIARVSIARGALDRARETLAAAIRLVTEMGTLYRGHFALDATSRLAAAQDNWFAAARFQGASDAAVDKVGGVRTSFDDPILASLSSKPRAVLGSEAYDFAYERGRELSLEAALGEARVWLNEGQGDSHAPVRDNQG